MKLRVAVIVLCGAAACAVSLGQAGGSPTGDPVVGKPPKPALAPIQWELEIELDQLRAIPVTLTENGKPIQRLFWYLRYKVINRTEDDQNFVPEFVLYGGTGQLLRGDRHAPTSVFLEIKKLHNDPSLRTQTSITTGKILRGQDNARTGVAIWPDFDAKTGQIDIFIGGLSGETKSIDLPAPVQAVESDYKGQKKTVTRTSLLLAKTLHLRYEIPGEQAGRRKATPKLLKKEWVMR